LAQLLALLWRECFPRMAITLRREGAVTAAWFFAQWLHMQSLGLPARDACDPSFGEFVMPVPVQDRRLQC